MKSQDPKVPPSTWNLRKRRASESAEGEKDRAVVKAKVWVRKSGAITATRIQSTENLELAASPHDQLQSEHEGRADGTGAAGDNDEDMSLQDLRKKMKPFKIVGSKTDTARRVANLPQRPDKSVVQGRVSVVQPANKSKKRCVRRIVDSEDDEESASGDFHFDSCSHVPNNARGTGIPPNPVIPVAGSVARRNLYPPVEFPSRERGTALPRPRPTDLTAKDKGKQRAVTDSGSEFDPQENEFEDRSEDENFEQMDTDRDSRGPESPTSQADSVASKKVSGEIDDIMEDIGISDIDPDPFNDDNEMSDHPDCHDCNRNMKQMKNAIRKTNQNVSQIGHVVRNIARVMKKMEANKGSTGGTRDGKKAKKPLDLDDVGEAENLEGGERDPHYPYRGGPGGADANPQVLLIMWKMMRSVGVQSFRPIWENQMSSPENKFLWQLATAIFIRLVQCGEYDDVTKSEAKSSVVYNAITLHARQRIQRVFREYTTMSGAELQAREKLGVRRGRLNVWKKRRCNTATSLTNMWSLCPLIKAASSDDETDDEEDFSTEAKKRCRVLRLPWRSAALEKLLVQLDQYQERKKKESPKGVSGAKPRVRIREKGEDRKESMIPAPAGLSIDCYSEEWLSTLDASEIELLEIDPVPKLKPLQKQARILGL
ncbi:uncharacterized protein MELLADRAFT_107410 [Melampsora larici-populina 98AG31]|uniref:Uncharacterized protein n=1 Tax=Melampsora larici-populina (strain 98AG31 / pathotype 3-4-7) TaxID=747676 RepID=F4RPQ1_MELLP|nr:uncharacterized protein MELLADRAFT_107410 [Melampsora larici-populina 98AG31]EGG05693.1 hypothetical protein MELLADRAFT_107410 [Melampsora larici-populina 98AG31]